MPERGSVLMLMPAAVLVLLVLAAITVDHACVFLGEREVADAAAAAANDVATLVDEAHYRATGEVRLECDRAQQVADAAFAAREPAWLLGGGVEVVACGGDRVRVVARGDVGFVFAKAIPGAADRATVEAAATAVATRG